MRWLTTKTLFALWRALMWGDDDDLEFFLHRLAPTVDDMKQRSQMKLAALKAERAAKQAQKP